MERVLIASVVVLLGLAGFFNYLDAGMIGSALVCLVISLLAVIYFVRRFRRD